MNPIPDLESLRWHARVLLIFASAEGDGHLEEQRKMIDSDPHGFAERDLKVYYLAGGQPAIRSLRSKLHAGDAGFGLVLIGKDGSVKMREHRPVAARELFDRIDGMPMRREEMRQYSK